MRRVRGIYDGSKVILSEPLPLPPNSTVEVLILESPTGEEAVYWQQLLSQGLVKEARLQPIEEQPFTPARVSRAPVSQTIVEERR
jgi:hypothetical protein